MILTYQEALQSLTVPEIKRLVRLLPDVGTQGCKADVAARLAQVMQGGRLKTLWDSLDAT